MKTYLTMLALFTSALAACTKDNPPPAAPSEPPPSSAQPVAPTPTPAPSSAPAASVSITAPSIPTPDVAQTDDPGTGDDPVSPDGEQKPPPPGVNVDDVREAVFRHQMGENASGQGASAGVYCLQIENRGDPTVAFLARFKDVKAPVRAASGCSMSPDKGVVDKLTRRRGLEFNVDSIVFKDARHCTVNGGYYEAGLSASGNVYTLELKGSKWVVVKDQMMWIS